MEVKVWLCDMVGAAWGTLNGNFVYCDVTDISYSVMWYRGATADQAFLPVWPPYKSILVGLHPPSTSQF